MGRKVICSGKIMLNLTESNLRLEDITEEIWKRTGLSAREYYLVQEGKVLKKDDIITSNVECVLRLLGGKGGFGSMLRAIGAQIEKTTNREACRDLSGRRLRDINEEKRLKAWLEKQKDRESEAEEKRRKKLEKLIAVPKHEFKDSEYENARSELTEKVNEAVEEGFKKALLKPVDPISIKRKAVDNGNPTTKRAALWIGDDLGSSSDDSESDADYEEGACSSSIERGFPEKAPCVEEVATEEKNLPSPDLHTDYEEGTCSSSKQEELPDKTLCVEEAVKEKGDLPASNLHADREEGTCSCSLQGKLPEKRPCVEETTEKKKI